MERDRIVDLKLGILPEAAVSGAVLLQTETSAHLLFNAMRGGEDAGLAVVEFTRCLLTRFGYPNDEARWGISSYAHVSYGIYEVERSSWIEEVVRLNRLRFPGTRDDYVKKHYLFTFHDSTLQCLADGMKLEVTSEPFDGVLQRIAKRGM